MGKDHAIVRIWISKGKEKLGHASLELYPGNPEKNLYISIYPQTPFSKLSWLYRYRGKKYKVLTLEKDLRKYMENCGKPEKIELFDLDLAKIESTYQEIMNNGFNFSMLGSLWEPIKYRYAYNCCSIVEYLLNIGGIYKIIESNYNLNLYNRLAMIYSALLPACINGMLFGYILNGIEGAIIYAFISSSYVYLVRNILWDIPSIRADQSAIGKGILVSIVPAIQQGITPFFLWGWIKGIKVGFRLGKEMGGTFFGIFGILLGFGSISLLSMVVGGIVSAPTNIILGAIAGFLGEGTGLFLTPYGLLKIVQHAEESERLKMRSVKNIDNISKFILGLSNEIIMVGDFLIHNTSLHSTKSGFSTLIKFSKTLDKLNKHQIRNQTTDLEFILEFGKFLIIIIPKLFILVITSVLILSSQVDSSISDNILNLFKKMPPAPASLPSNGIY